MAILNKEDKAALNRLRGVANESGFTNDEQAALARLRSANQNPGIDARSKFTNEREIAGIKSSAQQRRDLQVDPNIPVNTTTGGSLSDRFGASFRPTIDDKFAFLNERHPGKVFIRKGDLFIRQPDGKGGEIDVKFDESGGTGMDIIDAAGAVPEVGAAIATAIATRNVGPLKSIAATNLAGSGIGGLQDAIVRIGDGQDIAPEEILTRRGSEALIGGAFDRATLGLTNLGRKAFNRTISPFGGNAGELQEEALKSIKRLNEEFGIEITPSPGMVTGSPLAIRAEVFSKNVSPGGPLALKDERMREDLKRIQDLISDEGTDILPDDRIISEFTEIFAAEKNEILKRVHGINQSLSVELAKDFEKQLVEATKKPAIKSLFDSGVEIRRAVESANQKVREQSRNLYDNAFGSIRRAGGGEIEADDLIGDINQALKRFPENTKGEIIDELFPSLSNRFRRGFQKRGSVLNEEEVEIANPITFDEGKRILNQINERIKFGSPGGGVDQGTLKRISSVLDRSLKKSISGPEFNEARTLLKSADTFFKNEVLPFRESGVRELFIKPVEGKFVPNENIILELLNPKGGITKVRQLRTILGDSSNEFGLVKRAFMDKLLEPAMSSSLKVDGQKAFDILEGLDGDLRRELFGKQSDKVIQNLKTVATIQGKVGGDIPIDELRKLAAITSEKEALELTKGWRVSQINERVLERNYKNNVIKALLNGKSGDEIIDPDQFVDLFYNKASATEIKQVMSKITNEDLKKLIKSESH